LSGGAELIENNHLLNSLVFRVKDDSYNIFYNVQVIKYNDAKTLQLKCSCPYNLSEVCRHKAAALFQLQELLDKNMLDEVQLQYHQKHTVIKMKQLDLRMIRMLSSSETFWAAENYLRSHKANILEAKDERVIAELDYNGESFKLLIQKNEERNFDTSCTCNSEIHHPLCVHKSIVLLQLLNAYGANFFDGIRNWDKEKNKLLSLYGYSLTDDLTGKFEFTYNNGKPFLKVLDSSIKRVVDTSNLQNIISKPVVIEPELVDENAATTSLSEEIKLADKKLGVVINENQNQYPFFQIDAVQGEADESFLKYTGNVEKIDLNKFVNTDAFNDDDKILLQSLRKLLPAELNRYLNRNSPFSGIWENIIQPHDATLPEETRNLINEYLHPKLKKMFGDLHESAFVFYLPEQKTFKTANLQQVELSSTFIVPEFYINFNNNVYEIECKINLPLSNVNINENECSSSLLFQYQQQFFLWDKPEDVLLIEKFLPTGKILIPAEDWQVQLQQYILPLSNEYKIEFGNLKKKEVKDIKPEFKIILQEKGDYLLFHPTFTYQKYDVKKSDNEKIVAPVNDTILIIQRNLEAENIFTEKIKNLHSHFIHPHNGNTLALRGEDVLKNNWFFLFIDAMKEMNVEVYGYDVLKKFRFNTAKPSTKIFISSHTDWFDAKVDIYFGEQQITVADVKKALQNKQQFVQLGDGTLGILPEEWIKKYSLLFRIGEGKSQNIKLSKYHFNIIEELYDNRNEEELVFELEEKYEQIKNNYAIHEIEAPQHLQQILRPYQTSGFQWLNYLSEVQWNGILADDMGLGKTVQALAFLYHLKEKNGSLKALVACPTTLIFNWQNEIKKFTPTLQTYIHHGGQRLRENLLQDNIDVIITTYGTLRSDIKQFIEPDFDYVILDESQAIKNPNSKIAKAACLLKTKRRLCLSGTPLQNNTFDIFSQMNFLNPGMLGSVEFFKQEFAIPIDKFGEKEQKEHLRKLLYPFILRRTKEQVAKDLPEKQETILYCEMGDEQRKIYDAYRNDYRDKILGIVETQGVNKSQLTILQGLMRLRQICDSPAIINETEKYPNASVKLDEI
jgi:non-specific serine/threonine protein kinase